MVGLTVGQGHPLTGIHLTDIHLTDIHLTDLPMSDPDYKPSDFIPKPCRENWHAMTGDEKKRHCEKCNTHVHDVTGMDAEEILALREKKRRQAVWCVPHRAAHCPGFGNCLACAGLVLGQGRGPRRGSRCGGHLPAAEGGVRRRKKVSQARGGRPAQAGNAAGESGRGSAADDARRDLPA